ncbi:MAG: acyl carrier protein [Atopobiaceae bacterium]|jgi:acyl carrier protein|nr:acyl carrier protein [Atopobiaceae bacterium]
MDRTTILAKVASLVAETLEVEEDKVTEGLAFADLGADSFDLLELVTAFEDEFGLTMEDDSLEDIKTIGDVVDAICDAQ